MKVWHDRSYLGVSDNEFISHGYAEAAVHSVWLDFEYTHEQRRENTETAKTLTLEQHSARCIAAMKYKSSYIFPVMDAIAKSFVCCQYDKEHWPKCGNPDWELFFWCSNFSGELCGRDYSHIQLSFNQLQETSYRKEICDRLLSFLEERFSEMDNLSITVQHETRFFDEKIRKDAAEIAKRFDGMKTTYRDMSGRFLCTERGLIFIKKYARSRGYKVSPRDILKLSWETESA